MLASYYLPGFCSLANGNVISWLSLAPFSIVTRRSLFSFLHLCFDWTYSKRTNVNISLFYSFLLSLSYLLLLLYNHIPHLTMNHPHFWWTSSTLFASFLCFCFRIIILTTLLELINGTKAFLSFKIINTSTNNSSCYSCGLLSS